MAATLDARDGDLAPGLTVVDGLESVRQRCLQRLRFFLGEWFLDTSAGVPYYRDILTRPTSAGLAVTALTEALRTVEDVLDVLEPEGTIDPQTREFSYRASVVTPYGRTEVGN